MALCSVVCRDAAYRWSGRWLAWSHQSFLVWSMSVKVAVVWNLSRSTKVSKSECWITLAVCAVDCRDAAYRWSGRWLAWSHQSFLVWSMSVKVAVVWNLSRSTKVSKSECWITLAVCAVVCRDAAYRWSGRWLAWSHQSFLVCSMSVKLALVWNLSRSTKVSKSECWITLAVCAVVCRDAAYRWSGRWLAWSHQSFLVWSMSVKVAVVWNLSRSTKVSKSECWITLAVCAVDCRDAAYRWSGRWLAWSHQSFLVWSMSVKVAVVWNLSRSTKVSKSECWITLAVCAVVCRDAAYRWSGRWLAWSHQSFLVWSMSVKLALVWNLSRSTKVSKSECWITLAVCAVVCRDAAYRWSGRWLAWSHQSFLVWSMSVKVAVVWNLSRSTKVSKSECWITLAVCAVVCRDAAYRWSGRWLAGSLQSHQSPLVWSMSVKLAVVWNLSRSTKVSKSECWGTMGVCWRDLLVSRISPRCSLPCGTLVDQGLAGWGSAHSTAAMQLTGLISRSWFGRCR